LKADSACFVYWIYRKSDTDLTSQGYIGISNNPASRFKSHKKKAASLKSSNKNHRLYNSLNKYDDFKFEVLLKSTREYCLEVEKLLRPLPNIGLNHAAGGKYTPGCKDVGLATREKLREAAIKAYQDNPELSKVCGGTNKGRIRTPTQRKKLSESHKGIGVGYENPTADKSVWKLATEMHKTFHSGINKTYYAMSKHFNLKVYQTKSIFNLIKTGWNPLKDNNYLEYIKD